MTGWDSISRGLAWFGEHQIGVTIAVLVLVVPWYIRENTRRKGDCESQVWFMFSINVIGVVAGLYVLIPTLIASLGRHPVNDQETLMAAFGSFAVVIFTGQNIFRELKSLFSKEVQPKKGKQSKNEGADSDLIDAEHGPRR